MTAYRDVALITGASGGLGRRVALGCAASGYRVALHYHSGADAAAATAEKIEADGGETLCVPADLSVPKEADRLVARVLEEWGGIHVLVNNAAIILDAPVASMTEASWDAVLGVDLSGPFYLMRRLAETMRAQGGGHMVNIFSIAGVRGSAGQANYAAAKAGLAGLTRAAALEWGGDNIRVNGVSPGFMETDMTQGLPETVRRRALEQSCLKRYCDPGDVVDFIRMLVRTSSVTGQVFHLDNRIS